MGIDELNSKQPDSKKPEAVAVPVEKINPAAALEALRIASKPKDEKPEKRYTDAKE